MEFESLSTARIVYGDGTIARLGSLVPELGTRPLLVTDPGIVRVGHLEKALASLRQSSIEAVVYSDAREEPTERDIEAGLRFAKEHGPFDCIIAFGGGSAMDTAKGINFLLTNGGKMEDYWGANKATRPMLPSIGIPTTAGTGSEAQSYALISQESTHRKMACGDRKARFRTIILDPLLTATLPQGVTAIAGIDAVTHALETSVTTKRNPMSLMYSREAWRLLHVNYEIVLREPENTGARGAMLLGAYLAGMAIELSMLGAAHACANPLSAHYGLAHGVAVGLMILPVVHFNGDIYGDIGVASATQLKDLVSAMKEAGKLPTRLRDCGVDPKLFPLLAKEATEQWTGTFNPRPVNQRQFQELYEAAY